MRICWHEMHRQKRGWLHWCWGAPLWLCLSLWTMGCATTHQSVAARQHATAPVAAAPTTDRNDTHQPAVYIPEEFLPSSMSDEVFTQLAASSGQEVAQPQVQLGVHGQDEIPPPSPEELWYEEQLRLDQAPQWVSTDKPLLESQPPRLVSHSQAIPHAQTVAPLNRIQPDIIPNQQKSIPAHSTRVERPVLASMKQSAADTPPVSQPATKPQPPSSPSVPETVNQNPLFVSSENEQWNKQFYQALKEYSAERPLVCRDLLIQLSEQSVSERGKSQVAFWLGECLMAMEDFSSALQQYQQVLEGRDTTWHPEAGYKVAICHMLKKNIP